MSTLSIRLPESLHEKVKEIAKREGISINQFLASALAEKVTALITEEYLNERAARGNRGAFESVMAKVQDRQPDAGDQLPGRTGDRPRSAQWRVAEPSSPYAGADPFLIRLEDVTSELSTMEKRICLVLHQNPKHTNAELAALFSLSKTLIAKHMNHIRRALGVERNKSLREYLSAL